MRKGPTNEPLGDPNEYYRSADGWVECGPSTGDDRWSNERWNPGGVYPWPRRVMRYRDEKGPPTRVVQQTHSVSRNGQRVEETQEHELHVIGDVVRPRFPRLTKREPSDGGHARSTRRAEEAPLALSDLEEYELLREMGGYASMMQQRPSSMGRSPVPCVDSADEPAGVEDFVRTVEMLFPNRRDFRDLPHISAEDEIEC